MKLFLAILVLACLLCCAAVSLAEESAALPDLPERLPVEYKTYLKEGAGTVKKIQYPSKDYTGDGAEVIKNALIYLPAGYSDDKQYFRIVFDLVGGCKYPFKFILIVINRKIDPPEKIISRTAF